MILNAVRHPLRLGWAIYDFELDEFILDQYSEILFFQNLGDAKDYITFSTQYEY